MKKTTITLDEAQTATLYAVVCAKIAHCEGLLKKTDNPIIIGYTVDELNLLIPIRNTIAESARER